MPRLRRTAAAAAAAVALVAGLAGPAQARVVSPSGAWAETSLVCQRLWGSYATHVAGSGFHYARVYVLNGYTGAGGWTGWTNAFWGGSTAVPLPRMGSVALYFQYAYWNGATWEITGEWAKVYNARGEHVSYWC